MFSRRICTLCYKTVPRSYSLITQSLLNNVAKPIICTTLPTFNKYVHISATLTKSRDKKKENKGKRKIEINEEQLREVFDVDKFKTHLRKSVDDLKYDYTKKLSLRSTSGSIESLVVEVDGKEHILQELAQIIRKNPGTLVINLGDFPQAISAVLKSIRESGMNLNPQQEGTTLYIPVPKVTKEHREILSKNAKMLFVKCKDNIRSTQNEQVKKVMKKKNSGLAEDTIRSINEQICTLADQHIAEAEIVLTVKQAELLGN